MIAWLATFGKTHLTYIVIILIGLFAFRTWLAEHDARLAADATVKTSQATVQSLQQQIAATNMAAAAKVQTIVKVVHDAATPQQVVAALPQVDPNIAADLSARVAPDNPVAVEVAAPALMAVVGDLETSRIQLGACQANLTAETAIAAQKDVQITALRKKPSFWHRVGGTAKAVGIGIGIGALIAVKL